MDENVSNLVGSLASAGAGLSVSLSKIGAEKRAKKLMDYQSKLNMQQWEEQVNNVRNWNEYDERINKMLEAGLNPLYSEGSPSQASISPSMPSSPYSESSTPASSIEQILQSLSTLSQLRLNKANEEKANQDVLESAARTNEIIQTTPANIRLGVAKVDNLLADTQNKKDSTELARSQISVNQATCDTMLKDAETRYQNLLVQRGLLALQRHNSSWQEDVARQGLGIQQFEAMTHRYDTQANWAKISADIKTAQSRIDMEAFKLQREMAKDPLEVIERMRKGTETKLGVLGSFTNPFAFKEAEKYMTYMKVLGTYSADSEQPLELRAKAQGLFVNLNSELERVQWPPMTKPDKPFKSMIGSPQQMMFPSLQTFGQR